MRREAEASAGATSLQIDGSCASPESSGAPSPLSPSQLRKKRIEYFERLYATPKGGKTRCVATTQRGTRCKNDASHEQTLCSLHARKRDTEARLSSARP